MTERRFERIAVTGLGTVTSLGENSQRAYSRLISGDIGIEACSLDLGLNLDSYPVGCVEHFDVPLNPLSSGEPQANRCDLFAIQAAREALKQANLIEQRIEALVGETAGTSREAVLDEVKASSEQVAQFLRRMVLEPLGATGLRLREAIPQVISSVVLCSACSSGALAIAMGAMRLEQGSKRPQLVGGTDALNALTLVGFGSLGALSKETCRPFDAHRRGLNLGEGAAFLVLETESMVHARGGTVLAWLDGYAVGAEAHHLTHPEATGMRSTELFLEAMSRAGFSTSDIGYVNAHGTATEQNDAMEAKAIGRAFGEHANNVLVSSSKGQLGHTLGAAGAIEAAIVVQSLGAKMIPPTAGLREPAPECALAHVIGTAKPSDFTAALSSSFGFGGAGAVLAFSATERQNRRPTVGPLSRRVFVKSAITLGVTGILRDLENADLLEPALKPAELRLPFDPLDALTMERSRRFDRLTALTALGTELILANSGRNGKGVGLSLGNALGDVSRSAEFIRRVKLRGPRGAPPAEFPHLLPSSVSGNASIYSGLTGPVFNVSDVGQTAASALALAMTCLRSSAAEAMIIGTAETIDDAVYEVLLESCCVSAENPPPSDGAAFLLLTSELPEHADTGRYGEILWSGQLREWSESVTPSWDPLSRYEVLSTTSEESVLEEIFRTLGRRERTVRTAQARAGFGWHLPGFLYAAATARIFSGAVDSVAVVTDPSSGLHLTIFARV
jgi:3-oxoacyl-[acyl-carrier-protein] synthase II